MRNDRRDQNLDARTQLKIRLAVMAIACAVLAFLVSVDHERWFRLRPASGTAAAMFYAAHPETPPATPKGS